MKVLICPNGNFYFNPKIKQELGCGDGDERNFAFRSNPKLIEKFKEDGETGLYRYTGQDWAAEPDKLTVVVIPDDAVNPYIDKYFDSYENEHERICEGRCWYAKDEE